MQVKRVLHLRHLGISASQHLGISTSHYQIDTSDPEYRLQITDFPIKNPLKTPLKPTQTGPPPPPLAARPTAPRPPQC
jgi:hypothetical protein